MRCTHHQARVRPVAGQKHARLAKAAYQGLRCNAMAVDGQAAHLLTGKGRSDVPEPSAFDLP
eukprot:CAMPEP_0180821238 /NCGR_PEP_ID=MMETSP1038_2-20121128/70723_1 /TAXON_ID=632150 /ORGANISM="Azadinium spinosum, Strain 3D9" /LENGTH=61 /DNA_ID=CAMNT_0022863405 /DNA_START=17 /DNA_END=198 /DNA_ORIENTATION=+